MPKNRSLLCCVYLYPVLLLVLCPTETQSHRQSENNMSWCVCVCVGQVSLVTEILISVRLPLLINCCLQVSLPGLQLQGSLFSRHQERPGNCNTAGLFQLDGGRQGDRFNQIQD